MSNPVTNPPGNRVVVVTSTKSVGISVLLTFLFGPLGMLYSTIKGAIIMAILSIVLGIATFGIGTLLCWPICMIRGARAVKTYNQKLMAQG